MIIAIDGPAGTGKSTVAKSLAKRLNFFYFDTGAMYRAFSLLCLNHAIDIDNEEQVKKLLDNFNYDIKDLNGEKHYFLNKEDVTQSIRTPEVTSIVSKIASYPFLREELVKIQRKFGEKEDAVFEGRDMGTVVFPNAEVKIFLTANPEVRAERRYKEFQEKFPEKSSTLSLNQILEDIQKRDHTDATREVSPLKQASDAHLIDTSQISANEVVDCIILKVRDVKKKLKRSLFYKVIRFIAKCFFKLFFRLKVYGVENIPKRSCIIASNHASFFDPPLIAVSCPYEIHFLARSSIFKNRMFSWLIKKLNAHPIGMKANDRKTFKVIFSILRKNQKLLIFPEGARSKKGELTPIKSGIGFIALKSGASIVPTYVDGTYEAWPRNKKFPSFFQKVSCMFGAPISMEDYKHLEKEEAIQAVVEKTEKSIKELQQHFKNKIKK